MREIPSIHTTLGSARRQKQEETQAIKKSLHRAVLLSVISPSYMWLFKLKLSKILKIQFLSHSSHMWLLGKI